MLWWQWLVVYAACGGLTVYLVEIVMPASAKDNEEGIHGFIFGMWPLFVLAGIGWCVVNTPRGIAWCARRVRERMEE